MQSPSNLQVTRTGIKSWTGLNYGQFWSIAEVTCPCSCSSGERLLCDLFCLFANGFQKSKIFCHILDCVSPLKLRLHAKCHNLVKHHFKAMKRTSTKPASIVGILPVSRFDIMQISFAEFSVWFLTLYFSWCQLWPWANKNYISEHTV